MATAFIVDPALEVGSEVRLQALRRIISACREAGTSIRILGLQQSAVDTVDSVAVEKLLTRTDPASAPLDARDAQRQLRISAIEFRNGLSKALVDVGSYDALHLLHASLPMLHGLASWASSVPQTSLPSLALQSLETPNGDAFAAAFSSKHAVAAAVDVLKTVFGERMSLTGSQLEGPSAPTYAMPREGLLPSVDIIITLHNYWRFLERCLRSVASQTYPAWRCIVVDDGSSDVTFDELRALVAAFGERFAAVRHEQAGGQLEAMATGLSLGSNPFVLMLDADDELTEHALDHHISWHLNNVVPVAMTSGRMFVIDTNGRMLAGAMDHLPWPEESESPWRHLLVPEAAWRRPQSDFTPAPAVFINQRQAPFGQWFGSPTSGLMLRRSLMELFLPDRFDLGRLSGDTYFALTAQVFGGSLLIDAHVGRYRRHGGNNLGFPAVYGSGTMAVPQGDPSWPQVAWILRQQIEANPERYYQQISSNLLDRFLGEAPLRPKAFATQAVPLDSAVSTLGRVAKNLRCAIAGVGSRAPAAIIKDAAFNSGGRGSRLLHVGWSRPENWGSWSVGPRATLLWKLEALPITSLCVSMKVALFAKDMQSVAVTVNGANITTIDGKAGNHTSTFVVSAELAAARSPMQIGFEIAHPISAKEVGASNDARKLGIGLEHIRLEYNSRRSAAISGE